MPKITNVNYSYSLHVSDEQNARGIFDYLLNTDGTQRPPVRGCYKVIEKGGKSLQCKCLDRIGEDIRGGIDDIEDKWEAWRPIFTRFAQLFRNISMDPYSSETMVQVMYEFNHTIGRAISNKVKAFVLQAPASLGPLMMDWNGLFELGGHDLREVYGVFYKWWLTDPVERAGIEYQNIYVLDVVIKHQTNLNMFLDCLSFAAQDGMQLLQLNRPLIINHRLATGYYITDRANFDYYNNKLETEAPIVFQQFQDRNFNLPVCFAFFREMDNFLVVAHPAIPRAGMPLQVNPICTVLFTTDGLLSTVGENAITIAGNVGVMRSDTTMVPLLLSNLQEKVKWDGSKLNGRVRTFNLETDGLINLYHELGVPVDVAQISTTNQELLGACRSLLPQINDDSQYDLKLAGEGHICPCPNLNQQFAWEHQSPHRASIHFLRQLEGLGIIPFIGVIPLQKEGKFVMMFPPQGTPPSHPGQLLFVPYKKVLLFPMQVFWVDSIRTSVAGNPSIYFTIF